MEEFNSWPGKTIVVDHIRKTLWPSVAPAWNKETMDDHGRTGCRPLSFPALVRPLVLKQSVRAARFDTVLQLTNVFESEELRRSMKCQIESVGSLLG